MHQAHRAGQSLDAVVCSALNQAYGNRPGWVALDGDGSNRGRRIKPMHLDTEASPEIRRTKTIYLPAPALAWLRQQADREHCSVSDQVNQALDLYMQQRAHAASWPANTIPHRYRKVASCQQLPVAGGSNVC